MHTYMRVPDRRQRLAHDDGIETRWICVHERSIWHMAQVGHGGMKPGLGVLMETPPTVWQDVCGDKAGLSASLH